MSLRILDCNYSVTSCKVFQKEKCVFRNFISNVKPCNHFVPKIIRIIFIYEYVISISVGITYKKKVLKVFIKTFCELTRNTFFHFRFITSNTRMSARILLFNTRLLSSKKHDVISPFLEFIWRYFR